MLHTHSISSIIIFSQLKKDSEKENISETVIRKKILVKTVIRKNISERMLKTMKKANAPPRGERGAVAKAKPQKLLVS